MGECVTFYKNFSKRPFYDGSSLLPREWVCTFQTLFYMALSTAIMTPLEGFRTLQVNTGA